jgi:NADH:ubiquinone reductase (H+-translocating)
MNKITILGGGYGGALAAARIARRGVPVTLVDAGSGLVERIRLHQVAAGDDLAPIPYARLFRDLPVDIVQARVTGLDRARKRVLTNDGELAYDKLVYALGSMSETPQRTVSVGNPLLVRARLQHAKHVAIVGGGLTGIETASEIAERHPHVDVTIVDSGILGSMLSTRARRHLHGWMERFHVTLLENTRVTEAEEDGVRLATGQKLYADVVLWCGAFRVSSLARESGLRVNERGQILVDEHLRSSDPSIFAIGDAAVVPNRRMSCALALPMGGYVADVLTGATQEPFRFGFAVQCISLGRNDGIIDAVTADDVPRGVAITGRAAAWVKELVCRYTVMSVRLETRGLHYQWPKAELAA